MASGASRPPGLASPPRSAFLRPQYDTNVSGDIIITNTTWTITGTPYILTADVVVTRGVTLTIEPGVVVKGQDSREFQVLGHLSAIGTVINPITFTSAVDSGPEQWSGLVFDGGTGELRHVTVRYGGDDHVSVLPSTSCGSNVAVRDVLAVSVVIESSVIRDEHDPYCNNTDYGLYVENSRVVVSDTLFANNGNNTQDYALYATGGSVIVTVTNSTFQSNTGYPLRIPAAALSQLRHNIFIANGYDRVRLYSDQALPAGPELASWPGLAGYEFEGSLTVPEGITLTVELGLNLYWYSGKGLTVNGNLYAVGTVENPITFTSSTNTGANQWNGITFGDGVGRLEHATVRYADYGIASDGGGLDLRYTKVTNNRYGIRLTGDGGGGRGDKIEGDVLFDPWLEMKVENLSVHNRTATDNTILTYNPSSHTYTRHYPSGRRVHFNADGTHDYTRDRVGNETTYTYNPDGTLATIGRVLAGESTPRWMWTFSYTDGHLSAIADPAGRVTAFEIDEHDDLVRVTFPDDSTRAFAYDAEHRMIHNEDGRGNLTTYIYDEYGRVRRSYLPARPVYDPQTDTYTTIQPSFVYTPSQVAYQLVNNMTPGDMTAPTDPLVTSGELVDSITFGRGGYQGHSNEWGSMESTPVAKDHGLRNQSPVNGATAGCNVGLSFRASGALATRLRGICLQAVAGPFADSGPAS